MTMVWNMSETWKETKYSIGYNGIGMDIVLPSKQTTSQERRDVAATL